MFPPSDLCTYFLVLQVSCFRYWQGWFPQILLGSLWVSVRGNTFLERLSWTAVYQYWASTPTLTHYKSLLPAFSFFHHACYYLTYYVCSYLLVNCLSSIEWKLYMGTSLEVFYWYIFGILNNLDSICSTTHFGINKWMNKGSATTIGPPNPKSMWVLML
jgi:hypothetical protein